jgi:formylglycine-generating enzyme required for sulfatase activity
MKKLLLLLIFTFFLFGFTQTKENDSFTPPGTVRIEENFFMDETEITNISWLEYVTWMKNIYGEDSPEYRSSYPDTLVWEVPFRTHYFLHPAFKEYPVVGITWKQAKEYCQWRSDRVMEQRLIQKETHPKMIIPKKIAYRLPTSKEWEKVASAGYLEKTQNKIDKKYSNEPTGNFKPNRTSSFVENTKPVNSYWPNKFGVYNILGNVAEMTDQENVCKGGSWVTPKDEVHIETNFRYEKAENWLGLRCVCEVEY